MLVSTLRRKAEGTGGGVIEINTRQTRLSQFDHTTGEYIKKSLSQRIYVFGDGATAPVQRDQYSAFLATCYDTNSLDICQVERTWGWPFSRGRGCRSATEGHGEAGRRHSQNPLALARL
jgi:putative transposase